eukprot:scaffold283476_cov19-Tisochrysis_lutea.AAC.1
MAASWATTGGWDPNTHCVCSCEPAARPTFLSFAHSCKGGHHSWPAPLLPALWQYGSTAGNPALMHVLMSACSQSSMFASAGCITALWHHGVMAGNLALMHVLLSTRNRGCFHKVDRSVHLHYGPLCPRGHIAGKGIYFPLVLPEEQ